MIVKLGEAMPWQSYRRRSIYVKATQMKDDFLYETSYGWIQGYKGQWLLELGDRVRIHLDNEAFMRTHILDRREVERL